MRWPRTSGSGTSWPTSSASTPDRSCSNSSNRSWSTTRRSARRPAPAHRRARARPGTCRRSSPSSSAATTEIAPCSPTCSPATGSSRSSGRAAIGKTAVAIATGRRLALADVAVPGGVWLARLETAATADEVVDTLIAALDVTGGEAALLRAAQGQPAALVILDNCEHVVDAAADLAVRLLDAAPGLRILCTSQVPLDVDGEAVFELAPLALADAVELFTRRASAQRLQPRSNDAGDAVRGPVPLPRRSAAGDRARRGAHQDAVDRGDHPPPRRPLRRAERPDQPQAGTPPGAQSDDPMELRPAVPRRPAWPVGARHVRRRRAAAPPSSPSSKRSTCRRPRRSTWSAGSPSRSLVIVDDEGASTPVRYRLLDSIRAFALEAMAEAGLAERALAAHAAWFADAAGSSTTGVRSSRQAEHLSFARAERANIDAALAWSAGHDPLLALDIVNGFGWAWVVLGDSRGAQRILAALDAAGDAAPARDRATALLLAGWIEASTGHLELARDHIAAATELADAIGDVDLQARCSLLPRLRRVAPRRVPAARWS